MFRKTLFLLAALAVLSVAARAEVTHEDEEDDEQDEPMVNSEHDTAVVDIPEIVTSSGRKIKVHVGMPAKLPCQLNKPLKRDVLLMWERIDGGTKIPLALGGKVMHPDKSRIRTRAMEGDKGEVLTVDDVTENDAGTYVCQVMAPSPKSITFEVVVTAEGEEGEEHYEVDDKDTEDTENENVEVSETTENGAVGSAKGLFVLLLTCVALCLL